MPHKLDKEAIEQLQKVNEYNFTSCHNINEHDKVYTTDYIIEEKVGNGSQEHSASSSRTSTFCSIRSDLQYLSNSIN